MNHKEQIKELALTVEMGLHTYISVHNKIFRESESSKSMIENISGKGVPMSKLLVDAEELIPLWDSIQDKIDHFSSASYPFLANDEKLYFDILTNYVSALRKTVSSLVEKQKVMAEGSKRFSVAIRSWNRINRKQKLYKKAISEYEVIGQQLNDAAHIIF